MADYRLDWVKERALAYLDEDDEDLFDEMLSRNDGELEDRLLSYLDDDIMGAHDIGRKLFFVYKTYYEKIVKEETVVAEEGECALLTILTNFNYQNSPQPV